MNKRTLIIPIHSERTLSSLFLKLLEANGVDTQKDYPENQSHGLYLDHREHLPIYHFCWDTLEQLYGKPIYPEPPNLPKLINKLGQLYPQAWTTQHADKFIALLNELSFENGIAAVKTPALSLCTDQWYPLITQWAQETNTRIIIPTLLRYPKEIIKSVRIRNKNYSIAGDFLPWLYCDWLMYYYKMVSPLRIRVITEDMYLADLHNFFNLIGISNPDLSLYQRKPTLFLQEKVNHPFQTLVDSLC